MNGLNNKQLEACCYIDGPLLILAGAGSGKTRVITHRIAYLIDEIGVNPYNILAITFTNKAANEMRERIDKIVGYGSESIWVSTFHSMCVRILRKHIDKLGGTSDFTIYDTDEQKIVMREVLKYLKLDVKMYPERAMLNAISKAKEQYISPDQYEKNNATSYRNQQIATVYREYQSRLRRNNALDFDDLIYKTIQLFEHHNDVLAEYQTRFKYIMVDEYQDTNHSQFLLVKFMAKKFRNLCVVGDDDQSIYKFRGANIFNILNFENEYTDSKVVKLEQNYRSTANILNAANGVIANNQGRKDKTLWTEQEDGEKVHFTKYDTEYQEADSIALSIEKKYKEGIAYDNMAILYRTNNQSRVLEEKLLMRNIPYKIHGGTNFYSRKEIKDMVCYLKCIANVCDDVALKRVINVPKRGIGDTTVAKVFDFAIENNMSMYEAIMDIDIVPGVNRAAAKIKDFTELIEDVKQQLEVEPISFVYDLILERTGYLEELQNEGTDEAKARIENLKELKNKIVKYEEDAEHPNLTELLEDVALVADVDSKDEDADLVTLMTLHSAKGLEFPYVFIGGMEDGLFPSYMSIDSDDPDAIEEERRLCYVGITRAMKELNLSAATTRMVNGNTMMSDESRFIKEIPVTYIERDDMCSSRMKSQVVRSGFNGASGRSENRNYGKTNPYSNYIPKPTTNFGSGNAISLSYSVGDTVKHIKFGSGVVTNIVSGGRDFEVTVEFSRVGAKKMFASLANLKKL